MKEALEQIADIAHFLRMDLLACGNTERANDLCIQIRKLAMDELEVINNVQYYSIAGIIRAHFNSMPVNFDRLDETEKLTTKIIQYNLLNNDKIKKALKEIKEIHPSLKSDYILCYDKIQAIVSEALL